MKEILNKILAFKIFQINTNSIFHSVDYCTWSAVERILLLTCNYGMISYARINKNHKP